MAIHSRNVVWLVAVALLCCCWRNLLIDVEGSHVVYDELMSVQPETVNSQYRTQYHFQPPRNWINDPNGPMYYNGVYHLFYQYNPYGAVWGNIVWAHSVSTDLVNWVALPPAIYPSKPFDKNGCWSGSATILPGNKPVIVYTGIDPQNRQVQNIAYPKDLSDANLTEWVKPDYNPVIQPVNGINPDKFRDPTTAWNSGGYWRLLVGSRRKRRGLAMLYVSRDFVHWTRAKHPLHSFGGTYMWECPDFYPVNTSTVGVSEYRTGLKYVLKYSLEATRHDYYTLGSYLPDADSYIPDGTSAEDSRGLRYDYGNFYASKSFYDAGKGRRILWGWSNESDSQLDDVAKGWAGIQTIPRVVRLDSNQRQLIQWPVEEIESLRGKAVQVHNKKIKSEGVHEISGIMASQADADVTFELSSLEKAEPFDASWTDPQELCQLKRADVKGGVGPFGLMTLASAERDEQTAVFFRIFKGLYGYVTLMCQDSSRSSLNSGLYKPTFGGWVDVDIQEHGTLSLRSLIDHSVVESFGAGGRTCVTSRVYPTKAVGGDARLFVFNNGKEAVKVKELKAWEMKRPLSMNGA